MRARLVLALVVAGFASGLACIPNPEGDFEDFQERARGFAPPPGGGGDAGFDGAPPTQAVEGVYYGACLSQLAFGRLDRVFNFYTKTKFTPDPGGAGGTLTLSLQALTLGATGGPPETVSAAGLVGPEQASPQPASPNVTPEGRYTIDLGMVTVPGAANPITGRDVIIMNTKLVGRFAQDRFCARLNGNVTQPVQLQLEPPRNICQFVPVTEGQATPTFTPADFTPEACPE